ncbi:MAG: hypothetical protein IT320_07935 [Anaerolineae bacterium]|nr:hypothetical protein [Anaerolineae bacterium]
MLLQTIRDDEFYDALADQVGKVVSRTLKASKPGHCLRISTLPVQIMRSLCEHFHNEGFDSHVVFLSGHRQEGTQPWEVSPTKLIELRNAENKPLLAFIPPGVKAAAEDSFDVSTFRELDLSSIPSQTCDILRSQLPEDIQSLTDEVINYLRDTIKNISHDDIVKYYLTIAKNNSTLEAAGGAIYQLGLVPDVSLLDVRDRVRQKLDRNYACIEILTDSTAPLMARIHSLKLENNTIQASLYAFLNSRILGDSSDWAMLIAANSEFVHLSFDKWRFLGEGIKEKSLLYVHDLALPARNSDEPSGPENPLYLDVNHSNSISIRWETDPKPATINQLSHFRIELINTDEVIVWESSNVKNTNSARAYRTKTVNLRDFRDLVEDDIYFFRVRAYNEVGEIINAEDPESTPEVLRNQNNPNGKRINESEDIWFWVDDDAPPPIEPQKNIGVSSLLEAKLWAQFNMLDRGEDPITRPLKPQSEKSGWASTSLKRADANYNVVYDAQTRYTITVNNLLRRVEQNILRNPDDLGRLRLDFRNEQTKYDNVSIGKRSFQTDMLSKEFLRARTELFTAIRGERHDEIVATRDLLEFEEIIVNYAKTYLEWLKSSTRSFQYAKEKSPTYLDVDTIEVLLPNQERAYLLAPTHPLRLLWHLQHCCIARAWLQESQNEDSPRDFMRESARKYLLHRCIPVNLPPIIRLSHLNTNNALSHFYLEQGLFSKHWPLYLSEHTDDKQSLRSIVSKLFGMKLSAIEGNLIEVDYQIVLQKMLRYLVLHPYTPTLKINVFNPAEGNLVVKAILGIEKERSKARKPSLRYEVHLFTRSAELDETGISFQELIDPERQVSSEADAFTIPSQNHLFPKLRLSKNSVHDFMNNPEDYEAHISILGDAFPIEVNPEPVFKGRSSYNYGLIQQQYMHFAGEGSYFAWKRQLIPWKATTHTEKNLISQLIGDILNYLSTLQSSVAIGALANGLIPTLKLDLPLREKNLLFQVHAYSDWVFILDKHLGLEYFDSAVKNDRPMYLLDFVPDFSGIDSEHLMLTTRAVEELSRIIRPVLDSMDIYLEDGIEVFFLELLRSLSGKLAFKLLSSPNQINEALGLAFARLFLEQYRILDNAIVIPLDAHMDLFSEVSQESLHDDTSLSRSDMLVVGCDPTNRTLGFHVVEVKWRSAIGDSFWYLDTKRRVDAQISNSLSVLQTHFEIDNYVHDRVDRQLKNKQLISLLEFYLDRSYRYGLISEDSLEVFRDYIHGLDDGYRLICSGSGLIFDLSFEGVASDYEHSGLFFHRVGRDYLYKLLQNGWLRYRANQRSDEEFASLEEALAHEESVARVLEDTTMRDDPNYETIREVFPKSFTISTSDSYDSDRSFTNRVELPPATDSDNAVLYSTNAHPSADPNYPSIETETQLKSPKYDVLLGIDRPESPQFGILGKASGSIVALDLNETSTISLFGVQGGGKSYTLGSIVEMASQPIDAINRLPAPLASVIFHFQENQDYSPEFVSMNTPNDDEKQLETLQAVYGAQPQALADVLLLTSRDKLEKRQLEFPSIEVAPILFSSKELTIKDWRFLMGTFGNQMYMKQINVIMRTLRESITLTSLRNEIEASELSENQKSIARIRLNFASQFIDDNYSLADLLHPGRLIIVDLRDEFIDKDEALGLFVVMLNIFANAGMHQEFNRLIVFDEAHKYMSNRDLTTHIVEVMRQMRHQGVSLLIASQDPPSLPSEIIELSSVVIIHRFNSPQWLRHLQRSIAAISQLTSSQLASLRPGEAYVWSSKSSDKIFAQKAIKVQLRPRVTKHGGGTKTAN